MIKSFRCTATQAFYETGKSKKFSSIGNRLEALVDDRKGQHSIRINDQWRICFRWTNQGAEDVEIVDYH